MAAPSTQIENASPVETSEAAAMKQIWERLLNKVLRGPPYYYVFKELPSPEQPFLLQEDLCWEGGDWGGFWWAVHDLLRMPGEVSESNPAGPPQYVMEVPVEEQLRLNSLWLIWEYLAGRLTAADLQVVDQNRPKYQKGLSAAQLQELEGLFPQVDPRAERTRRERQRKRALWHAPNAQGTIFLFPGQGVQEIGMGRLEVTLSARARELFTIASEILGYDLLQVCLDGPEERLNDTEVCQVAIYVCSMATVEVMREHRPELLEHCRAAAGLSLGEYSAYVFAGALSFEDGLRLVAARGRAMQHAAQAAVPSGMTAVLADSTAKITDVLRLLNRDLEQMHHRVGSAASGSAAKIPEKFAQLWPANYLLETSVTVAGALDSLAALESRGVAMGLSKMTRLKVAGAFHSPFMESANPALQVALAKAKFQAPRIPVIPNVEPSRWRSPMDPLAIRTTLLKQMTAPVKWVDTMVELAGPELKPKQDRKLAVFPIGPGNVTKALLSRFIHRHPEASHLVVVDVDLQGVQQLLS